MPKTILIVEDDDLLRDLTAESLSSLYAVAMTCCANADEALHYLCNKEVPRESPNKPSVMRESPQHLIRAAHEPDELFRL